MKKQTYKTPTAELISFVPMEDISASWKWEYFTGDYASAGETKGIWNAFDTGDEGENTYKYP